MTMTISTERNNTILKRVVKLISDFQLEGQSTAIAESKLNEVLLDSLDRVELIMCLEDEFGLSIPDEDAEKIMTVQDAVNYVATHDSNEHLVFRHNNFDIQRELVLQVPKTPEPEITGVGYVKSSVSTTLSAKQLQMFYKLGGQKWLRDYLNSRIDLTT